MLVLSLGGKFCVEVFRELRDTGNVPMYLQGCRRVESIPRAIAPVEQTLDDPESVFLGVVLLRPLQKVACDVPGNVTFGD